MATTTTTTTGADASAMEASVLAALAALYQPQQQPEQVQAADAFLRAFQVTPAAFSVAVALLDRGLADSAALVAATASPMASPPPLPRVASVSNEAVPVLFFAAQTLANKLRRQHTLPGEAQAVSFTGWCRRISAWLAAIPATLPRMVATQLVLGLAACLPRIPRAELDAIQLQQQQQQQQLPQASGNGGAIGLALHLLSSQHVAAPIVAEALVVLAEELSDLQERGARQRMQRELDDWAITVLDHVLPQLMQDSSQDKRDVDPNAHASSSLSASQEATQEMVLRAARAWLNYAHVPASVAMHNALLQSLLAFLRHEALFDVSVDLAVTLVRCYSDPVQHLPLIQWLVPQLMQLQDDFRAAARQEDTDQCLGLCRIFTEMGETYMTLLVGQQEMNQTVVVELLLDCMNYPDAEVADVTTSFWFRFLAMLNGDNDNEMDHHHQPHQHQRLSAQERAARVAPFHTHVLRLSSICMQNLQFTEEFPRLPQDKQQDFKKFRQALGDLLRDCCDALGVDTILSHCVQGLQSVYQLPPTQRRWEAVEAHLYCIRSIGRNVERAGSEHRLAMTPSLELIFQHLPQFAADHAAIQYTACLIISRYGLWLKEHHTTFLAPLVAFLHQCVVGSSSEGGAGDTAAQDDWQVASAAATALRSLAIDCWATLGADVLRFYLYVDQQQQQQQQQQQKAVMAVDDQVLILEGVCAGVARSRDAGAVLSVLEQVVTPIVERLSTLCATHTSDSRAAPVLPELLRLLRIYDHLQVSGGGGDRHGDGDDALVLLTERVWPAVDQVLALFRSHDELVERVCRIYKRMLRCCGRRFLPFLPRLMENLLSLYQQDPKSSYLYAASMVLKQFAREAPQQPELMQLLTRLLHGLVATTLPLFKSLESMQTNPDIVEEFFFLMERGVRNLPQVLLLVPRTEATGGGGGGIAAPPSFSEPQGSQLAQLWQCAVVALQISHNDANRGTLCFLEQVIQAAQPPSSCSSAAQVELARHVEAVARGSFHSPSGRELVDRVLRGVVLGALPRHRIDDDDGSLAGLLVLLAQLEGALLQQWVAEWFAHAPQLSGFLSSDDVAMFQHDLFNSANEREFRRVLRHFARMCSSRTEADALDGASSAR